MVSYEETLSRRSFAKVALAASVALTSGGATLRRVLAQDATPVEEASPAGAEGDPAAGELPPLPEGATLYAEGLWNPRSLAFGDDGTLYITESGIGGNEEVQASGQPEGTPAPVATPVVDEAQGTPAPEEQDGGVPTFGYTGQISQVSADGTQSVIIDGLLSYSEGVGAVGLVLGPGVAWFSVGGVAIGAGFLPVPQENTINEVDVATGELMEIAELGSYEVENNPRGEDINPNLYMIDQSADGMMLVVDAGGNTIYSVDPDTGDFTVAGVVPNLTELTGMEPAGDMGSGQAVPTSITIASDGTVYVGLLRENWPAEAPSILTMDADGAFAPFETSESLQWTVSLVAGPDGNLYASQLFGEMTDEGPGPGRVLQIAPDGTVTPVVEGVMMPHGVAFDADGNLYVAINTLMSGPGMAAGQVIRMDGIVAGM